jgi:hypothetical protein
MGYAGLIGDSGGMGGGINLVNFEKGFAFRGICAIL